MLGLVPYRVRGQSDYVMSQHHNKGSLDSDCGVYAFLVEDT
jgi:hypothetical protein